MMPIQVRFGAGKIEVDPSVRKAHGKFYNWRLNRLVKKFEPQVPNNMKIVFDNAEFPLDAGAALLGGILLGGLNGIIPGALAAEEAKKRQVGYSRDQSSIYRKAPTEADPNHFEYAGYTQRKVGESLFYSQSLRDYVKTTVEKAKEAEKGGTVSSSR